MSKLFWLASLLSDRKSMKGIFVVSGIGFLMLLALLAWAVVAGIGLVSDHLPRWLASGEQLAAETMRKAQETLPTVTDKVTESAPGLARQIEDLIPGRALPAEDVGGQDFADIPRFPGMVRVAYHLAGQKRTVAYQVRAGFGQVVAFYVREMAQRGFAGQVTSASPAEEIHLYRRKNKQFTFSFTKVSRLGSEITALEIREP
jgi:hypothetical protein